MSDGTAALIEQLRGRLIPAVPVPFDARGRIDTDAHHAYARWMARQSVGAVAVWVHTGRGLWLTDDQREEVLATWRGGAPRLPIICGVGVPRGEGDAADRVIARTVRMAEAARAGGAAAVMVHPPEALASVPDVGARLEDLHRAVAGVGLPVIAFHLYQEASGLAYPPDIVRRLLGVEGVIGIKLATLDSVMTFQELAGVMADFPESLLITGEDRFLGYSLMMGADAALVGLGAACTDVMAALLEAWFSRRLPHFVGLSAVIDALAGATFTAPMEGYVQRMLWALEADGVIRGDPLDPFGPVLPPDERDGVRHAVQALRGRD